MPRQQDATGYLAALAQRVIRDVMAETGTSQAELAKRLGVDDAVVRRALAAGNNPAMNTIERLATALGVRLTVATEQ